MSILAVFCASASAQQSPQDFTLPEPTPTSTPRPQGPVDDTGVVPVGPRVIPTDRPTPQPSETPASAPGTETTPAPVNTPPARPVVLPASPVPSPAATPTTTRPQPSPVETVPAPLPAAPPTDGVVGGDSTGSPAGLPALPTQDDSVTSAPTASSEATASDMPWLYIFGGLIGLLALAGGFLFWKRRRENAPPPVIKRPVVDAALDQVGMSAVPPRYEIGFEVEGLNRSVMAVMVSGRIVVKNRGERAIRDVQLFAEFTSAHHPSAKTEGNLAEVATVPRVGPHQTHRERVNLRLPIDQISALNRAGVPVFVPLLRVRSAIDGTEPKRLDFVLGNLTAETGQKLQPLRLDGPPGAYDNLRGHPLTT
ncbi:LPXTG cell wall anchor domain-containing protein [Altererythrobacter lutimaris]|uniref:LPXTG cell wall anchor domain-containing protein n=1 Tax=Altererythrobacter lutimaris TaxID=2743979 RepID=UPI001593646D|nr:LPXTG cell wall anchor domain-containing protein [Altererythrobacter lutimaris]